MNRSFASLAAKGTNKKHQAISSAFKKIPWNFSAHPRHEKVQNIAAPIDLNRGFLGNEEATSLFKEYVDALFQNDIDQIIDCLEPTFFNKTKASLQAAH